MIFLADKKTKIKPIKKAKIKYIIKAKIKVIIKNINIGMKTEI